jgi:hypothetical protein
VSSRPPGGGRRAFSSRRALRHSVDEDRSSDPLFPEPVFLAILAAALVGIWAGWAATFYTRLGFPLGVALTAGSSFGVALAAMLTYGRRAVRGRNSGRPPQRRARASQSKSGRPVQGDER